MKATLTLVATFILLGTLGAISLSMSTEEGLSPLRTAAEQIFRNFSEAPEELETTIETTEDRPEDNPTTNSDSSNTENNIAICPDIDSNNDDRIDITDFATFSSMYKKNCRMPQDIDSCGNIDVNADGYIDINDFANFSSMYKQNCN